MPSPRLPRRLRRQLALAGLVLATGCTVPGGADWIDPAGECATNTPPAVGRVAINSIWNPETQLFEGCLSVEWVDPGLDDAGNQGSDAPNMFGGMVSAEMTGASIDSLWLDEDFAAPGQSSGRVEQPVCGDDWGPTDELVRLYPPEEELDQTDPNEWPPDYSACTDWDEDGELEREDCFAGAIISFAVRARDRCDATSNVFAGEFRLGSTRLVSEEGVLGCETIPACPGAGAP